MGTTGVSRFWVRSVQPCYKDVTERVLNVETYTKKLSEMGFNVLPHPDPFDEDELRSWNGNAHAARGGQDDDEEEGPIIDLAHVVVGILVDGDDDLVSPSFALFHPIEEPSNCRSKMNSH